LCPRLRTVVNHTLASGPLGGHAVETGLIIAGTDALAADVVGAKLLGGAGPFERGL
jgi:uncharacterized protein (DUF362 family)